MRQLIYIILLTSAIWFTSCQTSKNLDSQKQVDYSSDFERIRSMMESLRADVSKQTQMTTDRLSSLKLENNTVDLSPPDSTGKQYPTRVSTTTASKNDQERQEVNESFTLTVQQLVNRMDSLSNKVDALINEKTKVVELSWWDLQKDKVYCCIIALLIVCWLIYRLRKK